MKKLAITLAALALSASTALAWDKDSFVGTYVLEEQGKNFDNHGIEGDYFNAGTIIADGKGGLTGWEFNDHMGSGFPDALSCKFNIVGNYWLGARGHIHLLFKYSQWTPNPAACALAPGTQSQADGSVTIDHKTVGFTSIGAHSAVSHGTLTR